MRIRIHIDIYKSVVFISLALACSCQTMEERNTIRDIRSLVESNIKSSLNLPENLISYSPFNNYSMDSSGIFNSPFIIYSSINTSCGTCIMDIELWHNIIPSFFEYNVPVVLICSSTDNFELFKYLCENGDIICFDYPFFLDNKNSYIGTNKFMHDYKSLRTVLVNSENEIILIGNPLRSRKILELYLNKIKGM